LFLAETHFFHQIEIRSSFISGFHLNSQKIFANEDDRLAERFTDRIRGELQECTCGWRGNHDRSFHYDPKRRRNHVLSLFEESTIVQGTAELS